MFPMMSSEKEPLPIMAYVRDMEGKVRALRADRSRFRQLSFFAGFAAGSALSVTLCLLFRYLH